MKNETIHNELIHSKFERRIKRAYSVCAGMMLALVVAACPAFAANNVTNDAMSAISNLSDFIFSLIRAVGLILLGYGILQVGLSFQSHDPSQRSNGILTIAGGIIIVFTKEILELITG